MAELVIILAALAILTLWIVGHNIYLWRTDVLTGSYISGGDSGPASAGEATETASKAAAEERRVTRALPFGWNWNQREPEPEGQIEAKPIDSGESAAAPVTPAKSTARTR